MKSTSSFVALAATLLLHLAAIAAVIAGLSIDNDKPAEPLPIATELLPPPAPAPALVEDTDTAALPSPAAPVPLPEKKRPAPKHEPKPASKPRPAPESGATVAARAKMPDAPIASDPVDSVPAPQALTTHAAPAVPTDQPAPPTRTNVSIPATYAASNRKPDYPPLSRRFGEQGTVVLRVFVKADGAAGTVEIKSSSGYPLLDNSARSAVQNWRFNPATSDGKPIAEWYLVSIPFKLQN